MAEKVWMRPPNKDGAPEEFDHTSETVVPLMVAGWVQCDAPTEAEHTPAHDDEQKEG
jgi:hypothetical protein